MQTIDMDLSENEANEGPPTWRMTDDVVQWREWGRQSQLPHWDYFLDIMINVGLVKILLLNILGLVFRDDFCSTSLGNVMGACYIRSMGPAFLIVLPWDPSH